MSYLKSRGSRMIAVLSLLSIPVLGGCADATRSDPNSAKGGKCVVKVGTLGPLSGPAADFGLSMEGAAKYAAAEVNDQGGLTIGDKKCEVAIVSYDTEYTSAGAAAAAEKFASENIHFVVGPVGAVELTGMKPGAARHDMLLVSDGFGRDALEPKYPLVFHNGPGPFVWAKPIIREAAKEFSFKKVVVIGANDQSGDDITIIDAEKYQELGYDVSRESYPRGTQDFAPIVSRLLSHKPDLIDFDSSPAGDVGTMIKQLRQAGYEGIFGRIGGGNLQPVLDVVDAETIGDMFYYTPVDINGADLKDQIPAYKKAVGRDADELSMAWTAGARALMRALQTAGTLDDTKAVAEALRKDDLNDPAMGEGIWTGMKQFGIEQEMSWPFYVGIIKGGQLPPELRHLQPEE